MSDIRKPIFIIGPGRSGTTLLLRLLSLHPDLAWFSGWTNRFPGVPRLSLFNRLNDIDFAEKATRRVSKWPRPAEAYGIWNYCFPGFSKATSDWGEEQVTVEGERRLRQLIKIHMVMCSKSQFLTKYTGWPRIKFIKAMFPDAQFIYIDRDPRAVVASYMKQRWWYKNNLDEFDTLHIEDKLVFYSKKYLQYYQTKQRFSEEDGLIQVYYEHLVKNPAHTLKGICEQVSLSFSSAFVSRLSTYQVVADTNSAWKKQLTPSAQEHLTELLRLPISELGYNS